MNFKKFITVSAILACFSVMRCIVYDLQLFLLHDIYSAN